VPTGQHAAHLLMQAELEGVICSGARRGKQFTYALLEERVAPARSWDRDESLAELTRRYFTTRGPATLRDFSWWSGLTIADAKRGASAAGSYLRRERRDDRTEWVTPSTPVAIPRTRTAHLLPNYDEYFIGFKDRSAIGRRLKGSAVPRAEEFPAHVLFVDGQIVGGWKRMLAKPAEIELQVTAALTSAERKLVDTAARWLGRFLELPVRVHGG
ncbi:MAG: DNA glycosylase AlkZ-like family protein, partial [Gemmatimonadaceae bacterium]